MIKIKIHAFIERPVINITIISIQLILEFSPLFVNVLQSIYFILFILIYTLNNYEHKIIHI